MIYRQLKNSGVKIAAIGLGTWAIGGRESPDSSRDGEYVDTIARAIEMGYNHIDTAEYYAGGHTEELIGEAITLFDRRELFLVSKVWPTHLREKDLHKALDGTLKRLRTDYVDMYLVHWPNPEVPLRETMKAMADEVRAGRTRFIGVSNFDTNLLKKAVAVSTEPVVNNQVLFNIEDRQAMYELLPFCQSEGITLTAYSPLKRNLVSEFTGQALERLAEKYYASPQQIMLAWLLGKEGVIVIPKAEKTDHLKSNIDSKNIVLTPEDMKMLDGLEGGALV
ncbi:MAG TPA: aldo/keto reductase [Mesotoga sp.]|nr:aldo/keto reductase [Mesotoga sp.]